MFPGGSIQGNMVSTDFHLRRLIVKAQEESKDTSILGNIRPLVDAAFVILDEHFDKFPTNEMSSELLVMFAEVATKVPPPMELLASKMRSDPRFCP